MKNNTFGIVVGVLVVIVLGIAIVAGSDNSNNSQTNSDAQDILAISDLDYVKGSENTELAQEPKVTVFEYGDFQCPFCAAVVPVVNEVFAEYANNPDVQFVYRHFPIIAAHPNAMVAHRAAEAAGKQDKFYDMHDLLFENQTAIRDTTDADGLVRQFAEQLNLDLERFDADFADSATLTIINDQQATGEALGVNSTPSFFVNETELAQPPRTADELRSAIEAELARVNNPEASQESSQ